MTPTSPDATADDSNNVKGAALMVGAMLFFAVEDALIKALSDTVPLWLIFATLGFGSAALFALILIRRGLPLWSNGYLSGAVILRNVAEGVGAWAFVSALALIPLATASAILQAAPILVAMGAALFLGETVGLRRWIAISVGFCGVLLIIRPGMAGFDINVLYAVLGVIGLALRDLATRRVPTDVHSLQLSMLDISGTAIANLTSNLNAQVAVNTNILKEISSLVVTANDFMEKLTDHWLLRSAFKEKSKRR